MIDELGIDCKSTTCGLPKCLAFDFRDRNPTKTTYAALRTLGGPPPVKLLIPNPFYNHQYARSKTSISHMQFDDTCPRGRVSRRRRSDPPSALRNGRNDHFLALALHVSLAQLRTPPSCSPKVPRPTDDGNKGIFACDGVCPGAGGQEVSGTLQFMDMCPNGDCWTQACSGHGVCHMEMGFCTCARGPGARVGSEDLQVASRYAEGQNR